jgi:predicted secreted protein
MAGQRGRDVLVSFSDGEMPEGFLVVTGIRAKTISFFRCQ